MTGYAIGVDLGGTHIKIAAVSEDGVVLERSVSETADDASAAWAETIRCALRELEQRRREPARWIGLAAPGLAAQDGLSIAATQGQLRGLEGLRWTDFLHGPRPVPVLNDAHAALLGEAWRGSAAGYRHVVMLTLGTGVGGALLVNGRLYRGRTGRAGHLGHICLNLDGPRDPSHTPGSLEDAVGNGTLPARSGGRFTSTRRLVEAHLSGDRAATQVWLRAVYSLACGLTSLVNTLDPEVIVLGGGIAQAGAALFEPLDDFMDQVEWRPQGQRTPILPAALGDIAGALGAAYNAIHWQPDRHTKGGDCPP